MYWTFIILMSIAVAFSSCGVAHLDRRIDEGVRDATGGNINHNLKVHRKYSCQNKL